MTEGCGGTFGEKCQQLKHVQLHHLKVLCSGQVILRKEGKPTGRGVQKGLLRIFLLKFIRWKKLHYTTLGYMQTILSSLFTNDGSQQGNKQ